MGKIMTTVGIMMFSLYLMTSCGSNSSDKKQQSGETTEKEKNVLIGNTYSVTNSPDVLNFEQITRTLNFITSNSVRFKKSNNFRKIYNDETATYRIEGNYVIVVFPDETQSLEIVENGNGLKSSDGIIFRKQ